MPLRGVGVCIKCECSPSLRSPLSYLPGIGSGETDEAMVTSGEAEIFLRWETLGERPRVRRCHGCFPLGVMCHTWVSGHQDLGANIITRCARTKSHTYDESWYRNECHIFTI
jgi:hypothetical protein